MPKPYVGLSPREVIAQALYFANDHPVHTDRLLDAYRDQVLAEAAGHLDHIADATEAQVAKHYGPASGLGPGSADMVREAAKTVRALATQPAT